MRGAAAGDEQMRAIFDETRATLAGRIIDVLGDLDLPLGPRAQLAVHGWVAFTEECVIRWIDAGTHDREALIEMLTKALPAVVLASSDEDVAIARLDPDRRLVPRRPLTPPFASYGPELPKSAANLVARGRNSAHGHSGRGSPGARPGCSATATAYSSAQAPSAPLTARRATRRSTSSAPASTTMAATCMNPTASSSDMALHEAPTHRVPQRMPARYVTDGGAAGASGRAQARSSRHFHGRQLVARAYGEDRHGSPDGDIAVMLGERLRPEGGDVEQPARDRPHGEVARGEDGGCRAPRRAECGRRSRHR